MLVIIRLLHVDLLLILLHDAHDDSLLKVKRVQELVCTAVGRDKLLSQNLN